ncbi:uncharacterized protein LOC105282854 [Ooceraea biroi]|uniref:uncharacterized protein LOC105282854 n=1 Tax=Ooceraea biroi TaxID=2015173 RepID=UPI000F08032E|nr:uncharacterized protein LOC105282854 [Ooceraea biroi]
MNALWNVFNLERPPNSVWNTNQKDMKAFSLSIDTVVKDLMDMDIFHKEAAVLGRLIYRMKSKFRSDKGLKHMAKLNKALITYNTMNLVEEYKTLRQYIQKEGETFSLPSRQMVEYVLVRTQAFAKLMARIEEIARYTGHFLKARIALGHAWSICLIAFACVSRIWFLSKQILKKCCTWYRNIYPHLNKFQYIGLRWLPENQNLPCNLESWLSLDWLNEEISSVERNIVWDSTMFRLLKPLASDNTDETNLITSDNIATDVSQENNSGHGALENKSALHTDVGEVINRKAFMTNTVTSQMLSQNTESPVGKKRKRNAKKFEKHKNKKQK